MSADPIAILAIVVAVGGSVLAWLLSDARAKGRSDAHTEKTDKIEQDLAETHKTMEMLFRASVAADAERKTMQASIEQKASKEAVDGISDRIKEMRAENTQHFRELRDLISQKENSGSFARIPKTGA